MRQHTSVGVKKRSVEERGLPERRNVSDKVVLQERKDAEDRKVVSGLCRTNTDLQLFLLLFSSSSSL